jgi:hypothetical protein
MKQTAVEWLEFRYKNSINLTQGDFKQAKEMEDENMINFLKSVFQMDGFDYQKALEQFKNK